MKTVQELKNNINKLRQEISDFELEDIDHTDQLGGIELALQKEANRLRLKNLYKKDGREFPSDRIYKIQKSPKSSNVPIDFGK